MVPSHEKAPVLVTTPLKKVVWDTNTVPPFVNPLLTLPPDTPLVSKPPAPTTTWPPLISFPLRLNDPPLITALPVTTESPLSVTVPELARLLLIVPIRKNAPVL